MKYLSLIIISFMVIISACNDSIEIGSGLLADEQLEIQVDSLAITAQTIQSDSVLTFRREDINNDFSNTIYLVGQLDGPQFGRMEATAYFSPTLVEPLPDLDVFTIEAVAMTLILDSVGRYGNPNAVHELELFQLTERIVEDVRDSTLYSEVEIAFDPVPLVTESIVPNYEDSLSIQSYTNDTVIQQLRPQLRFDLDPVTWTNILTSTDTLSGERLAELVPGFALKSTVDNSILGLDLAYASRNSEIVFFMTSGDASTRREFRLPLGRLRHNNFKHDYSGSEAEVALADPNAELLYIESAGGTDIELDLSIIRSLDDIIINNASIELTVLDNPNKDEFPAPAAIFASFKDEGGTSISVLDIGESSYGGLLEQKAGVEIYKIDITTQINLIADGTITSPIIRLFSNAKAQRANRTIICGPDHPIHPMKLKIIKTNP